MHNHGPAVSKGRHNHGCWYPMQGHHITMEALVKKEEYNHGCFCGTPAFTIASMAVVLVHRRSCSLGKTFCGMHIPRQVINVMTTRRWTLQASCTAAK